MEMEVPSSPAFPGQAYPEGTKPAVPSVRGWRVVRAQNRELSRMTEDFRNTTAIPSECTITIMSAIVSLLSFRVRSRASLELELIALRHQIIEAAPTPPSALLNRPFVLGVWLNRVRPERYLGTRQAATVIGWHRKGVRIHWRWRLRRSGRSKTIAEIRDLFRQMSSANSFWGAPRIHGQLPKLGVDVSQATVGLARRPKAPSPIWRSFLHNHLTDTVGIEMGDDLIPSISRARVGH